MKQSQKWQIPMRDFTNACKALGIANYSKITEFANKRADEMQRDNKTDLNQIDESDQLVSY